MGVQMKCSPPPLPSPAEEGTFSCQVPSFSPLVLLADRHWNMPYRSWQLSPSGPDSTLLTVNGAHLQVKVEIKVGTADLLLSPHPLTLPPTHRQRGRHVCVSVCACVLMQSRCSVRVKDRVYCVSVQCEMLCSHPPPHSSLPHAHSSSGGQVPSSATASANRGRGGKGGGAPPEQDGQSVDDYQGPHEGVCVCVHACVCACVRARVCVMCFTADCHIQLNIYS